MGKKEMHKDRSATGQITRDGWIDAVAKRDYLDWMKKGYPNGKPEEVVMNKPKKVRKKLTKEESMGKGEKIVLKNGKYILLPGASREDEMRLIELEIARRKNIVDERNEAELRSHAKGEPALKLNDFDDNFDDDGEEEEVLKPTKAKAKQTNRTAEKQPSKAFLVFQKAAAKGKEVIDSMGDYEGYFHRHGIVIDTTKVQSVKQLIKLMSDKGAMCVEYRKGFGLHMIIGTRRYIKSSEGSSYWSKRGIDVKGLKTTKQLIQLMVKNSASKMEVREGIPKLLPDFYLNKKTKKRERSGVWIDGKGRNQIAYTAVRVQG